MSSITVKEIKEKDDDVDIHIVQVTQYYSETDEKHTIEMSMKQLSNVIRKLTDIQTAHNN